MYDLIGDIHGYASPLKALLQRLGYHEAHGVWHHPTRKVIFLGDFIDRGPEQLETVRIAQRMMEAGEALSVMGNHEFNAIAWVTPDPDRPGERLRRHSARNRHQHDAFLTQIGENSPEHESAIAWFRTLPLYLDLPGLRVIHACWHKNSLMTLAPYLDEGQRIRNTAWPSLCDTEHPAFEATEALLKGLQIPLPQNRTFEDRQGAYRNSMRTRWWEKSDAPLTYRDLAMVPPGSIHQIPHTPVPEHVLPGYDGDKLLFVGHYWMSGTPAPLTDHIACLDYSIAAGTTSLQHRGKLCAYRWEGEETLKHENFIWVS